MCPLSRVERVNTLERATLTLYYAALYSHVAVLLTFFPLWMRGVGLSEAQIGVIIAAATLVRGGANLVIGHFADVSGKRKMLLQGCTLAALACCGIFEITRSYSGVFAGYVLMSATVASLIPLSESIILPRLKELRFEFGVLRSFGSASVVAIALLLGWAVDRQGIGIVLTALAVSFIAQSVVGLGLPGRSMHLHTEKKAPLLAVLRLPGYLWFLVAASFSHAAHGFFYSFSTFYWIDAGVSASTVGQLWAIGVISEIVVFSLSHRMLPQMRAQMLILLACCCGIVRWGLLAVSNDAFTAVAVQAMQGLTLGLTQVGVAKFIQDHVPTSVLSTGTGLFAACSNGFIRAPFILVGGLIYASHPGGVFALAAAICSLAAIAALKLRLALCNHGETSADLTRRR